MIPKPGKDRTIPTSYRPISLLSHLSQLFEKVLLSRIRLHLDQDLVLPKHQFGFRLRHDTQAQLVRVVDHVALRLNAKHLTIGVFLDVEKAFYKVWHPGLLLKLHQQGLPLQLVKLLDSYLRQRSFQVKHENITSDPRPIDAGVPQGSVLAPTLYVHYTADLPNAPSCTIATFADDTALFTGNKNYRYAHRAMERQLQLLQTWTTLWGIKINATKSKAVIFHRKPRYLPHFQPLFLHQEVIPYDTSATYLGVLLDNHLTFFPHLNSLANRARQRVG